MDVGAIVAFILAGLLVLAGILIYTWLGGKVFSRQGGRLENAPFTPVDLFVALALMTFFLLTALNQWFSPPSDREITAEGIVVVAAIAVTIALGLMLLLYFRGLRPLHLLGIAGPASWWWQTPLLAFGLLLAAYPLIIPAAALNNVFLEGDAPDQEILGFFRDAASNWDVVAVVVMAVVVAPIVEEILFRGYFYRVLKQSCGAIPSLVLTSAVFSFVHVHPPAVLSLFVLACCLVIAYEVTGSLWTPILMHVFFNATTLWIVFYHM